MPDPNENPTDHGDFDREPWFNVIGPQHAGNVPLPPTDEVRPTDMIENGLTEEKMRWYDLVTVSGFEHVHTIFKTYHSISIKNSDTYFGHLVIYVYIVFTNYNCSDFVTLELTIYMNFLHRIKYAHIIMYHDKVC